MAIGLLGKKIGMTQVFKDDGVLVPVTVLEAGPCIVVQVKTDQPREVVIFDRGSKKGTATRCDGYNAIQIGFGEIEEKRINKPAGGHFGMTSKAKQGGKKALKPQRHLREFIVADPTSYKSGDKLTVDLFEVGEHVVISGTSKGRGFSGVVRRHNFKGAKDSHGTHEFFRHGGSIGQHTDPGRVWKGMKMPGQMGAKRVTVRNLEIVKVDPERNLLFIRGAVPGAPGGLLEINKLK
ncbi:50S ribosomal protein L3 [bacterium]|nr:50S ribosomal protein L3 [candidate division CSSED10-310 bacterium]